MTWEPKDPHNPKKLLRQLRFMFAFVGSEQTPDLLVGYRKNTRFPLWKLHQTTQKNCFIFISLSFPERLFQFQPQKPMIRKKCKTNRGRPWGEACCFQKVEKQKAEVWSSGPREESPPLFLIFAGKDFFFQPAVFYFQKVHIFY